jgi:hypothetical protein
METEPDGFSPLPFFEPIFAMGLKFSFIHGIKRLWNIY